MAGCDKADRNRKSAANTSYKAGNRQAINAKRKQAKHAKKCFNKTLDNPRGFMRTVLRSMWQNTAPNEKFQDWKKTLK